jgi:hypothetical protein
VENIMSRLIAAAGARRLLWLDHTAYSAALLAGGHAPWLDAAGCTAWQRQAQGLLRSDVLTLPLADLAAAWLARDATLLAAMAGKTRRAHGPLKECLASGPLRARAAALATALRAAMPGVLLVLAMPSPRDWVARVITLAGGSAAAEVDEDAVDAAAACIADFLRGFASVGVDAVLLRESRPWADAESALWIELYQPVANVARHYGWDWGVQLPEAAEVHGTQAPGFMIAPSPCGTGPTGLAVPASFWHGEALPAPPPGSFDAAEIPATAHPETVLARLATLRERQSTW